MWISVKAFMALEARDLVRRPNKESGMAAAITHVITAALKQPS